ncbi:hypothetical protein PIB30_076520 [Stylosanthes scabra]|uniref:Uncharacterized protein n=1 Tax=Stylosanthes scabra TaxID=79078 RepID=A0ABU6US32_9FABA|nr:hypothetical protein [Stylosanthes scabra]
MPVTKLTKLIYENCDKKRPAFLGCLKTNLQAGSSSQAAPPATPSAAPTSAATATPAPAPTPAPQHAQDDYYPPHGIDTQASSKHQVTPMHGLGVIQGLKWCHDRALARRGLSPLTTPRCGRGSPEPSQNQVVAWPRRDR